MLAPVTGLQGRAALEASTDFGARCCIAKCFIHLPPLTPRREHPRHTSQCVARPKKLGDPGCRAKRGRQRETNKKLTIQERQAALSTSTSQIGVRIRSRLNAGKIQISSNTDNAPSRCSCTRTYSSSIVLRISSACVIHIRSKNRTLSASKTAEFLVIAHTEAPSSTEHKQGRGTRRSSISPDPGAIGTARLSNVKTAHSLRHHKKQLLYHDPKHQAQ